MFEQDALHLPGKYHVEIFSGRCGKLYLCLLQACPDFMRNGRGGSGTWGGFSRSLAEYFAANCRS